MRTDKTNHVRIQTPEGVQFSLLLAGPVTRFLAWVVDLLCIILLQSVAIWPLRLAYVFTPGMALALGAITYYAISVGYGIALEWRLQGQTVGKRLLRLKVMDDLGLNLEFSQVVIRNLLRSVDMLPLLYLVGGLTCVFSSKARRLGDIAAGTVVVRIPEVQEPDLAAVAPGKYNSFRDHPNLVARLRQRVSPQAADVALRALMRRDNLDAEARWELFREMADYFRRLVQFPDRATDGLSDEQYVRNVVDVVFSGQRCSASPRPLITG